MAAALRACKTFIPVATETLRNIFFLVCVSLSDQVANIYRKSLVQYKASACERQSLVFPHGNSNR